MDTDVLKNLRDDDATSSEDEAPTEFSVSDSRKERLSLQQKLRQLEKNAKEVQKEKRRKRNELFVDQKESRLTAQRKRQSEGDAQVPAKGKKAKKNLKEASSGLEEDEDQDDVGETSGYIEDRCGNSGLEESADEDYLPLSNKPQKKATSFEVVTVKSHINLKKRAMDRALQFKTNRLYQSKLFQRQTAEEMKRKQLKRQAFKSK